MTLGGIPRKGFKSTLNNKSEFNKFKRIFPGLKKDADIDPVQLVDESRRLVLLRQNGVAKVQVPYVLANWLRPHQRLGVQFMFNCVAGISLPPFTGCILADDVSSQICMLFGLCLLLTLKNKLKHYFFHLFYFARLGACSPIITSPDGLENPPIDHSYLHFACGRI